MVGASSGGSRPRGEGGARSQKILFALSRFLAFFSISSKMWGRGGGWPLRTSPGSITGQCARAGEERDEGFLYLSIPFRLSLLKKSLSMIG